LQWFSVVENYFVAAQVAYEFRRLGGLDKLLGGFHEGMEDIPAFAFLAVESTYLMTAKSSALACERYPPEIFMPQLRHTRVTFNSIVGEGRIGIVQKPQHIGPVLLEEQ
jgi:hypothetical protein